MARLFTRKHSPFFQIEFRDEAGDLQRKTTRFRTDSRDDSRAAHRLVTHKESLEKHLEGFPDASDWGSWVLPYLQQRCVNSLPTFGAYQSRWRILGVFLRERDIRYPCQVKYEHAFDFVNWRKQGGAIAGPVSHNTAMQELDLLKMLLNEAARRDYVIKNPLLKLNLAREKNRPKPELSDEDVRRVREELRATDQGRRRWPEGMEIQFAFGVYAGRRISETCVPMSNIDLERGEILMRLKGGKTRGKPIHSALLPLLAALQEKGQSHTHEMRADEASKQWCRLFRRLDLPHTFHCFRVTFISRGRRAGVDRWTMMQIVDHASSTIHEVYNRYSETDLRSALERLGPPATAPAQTPAPPPRSSVRTPSASPDPARDHQETGGESPGVPGASSRG